MKVHGSPIPMLPTIVSDRELLDIAASFISEGGIKALPKAFGIMASMSEGWMNPHCETLLADALHLILSALANSDIGSAISALYECPPEIATQAKAILLQAFFPNGGVCADLMDDAAILCTALLAHHGGAHQDAANLLSDGRQQRLSPDFHKAAAQILEFFEATAIPAFLPKLIIWDLDDTLWRGTLAEGDDVVLDPKRAGFVHAFNERGLVSAICSKNDFESAKRKLESFDLWDAFIFPRIAFVPKGEAIRQLIDDMQLRPVNVLFVDDNPHNLNEVTASVPGIRVVNALLPECDQLLQRILEDHGDSRKSRVEEYRTLQAKVEERRQSALSNEAFLRKCDIRAVVTRWMDNVDFNGRVEELINRSNQLNYTASRVESGSIINYIMDIRHYDTRCIFVWDRYGYYGLVGFAMIEAATGTLIHFAFSCRIMHMGVEHFLLTKIAERYPSLDLSRLILPLPEERFDAIVEESFTEPDVRARIRTQDVPSGPSSVALRIMCDCQSGGIAHYSRYREEADFDNMPRLFSLPMMLTGAYATQHYPRYLIYSAGTDYLDWRWADVVVELTDEIYADSLQRFCEFVVQGDHRLLVFLPPHNAEDDKYHPQVHASRTFARDRALSFNPLWKEAAAQFPRHIACLDLSDIIRRGDMLDANHYLPPFFQIMASHMDDWYQKQR
jgi:FkbH-like protein